MNTFYRLAIFFVLILIPQYVHSATYYVSSTGSDSNSGTSTANPWQTIAKLNATTFAPGDFILFKSGDTFTGKLVPGQSGTSGNPITFTSYGTGTKPVIDGIGQTRVFDIRARGYLVFDGLELRNATNESIFLFNGDSNLTFSNLVLRGSTASVHFNSGFYSNISLTNIQAFDYGTYGINLSASSTSVTIDNFTGIASSTTATTTAIGLNIGGTTVHSNTIIRNSSLSNQRYGILRSPTNTFMTNFSLSSTTLSNNVTIGMFFQGGGSGYVFENLVFDNNGVSTTTGGGGGFTLYGSASTSDVQIKNVVMRNNYGPGLKIYGTVSGVDIRDMVSTGNKDLPARSAGGIGMLLASVSTSTVPITVRNAILTDNMNNGFRSEPNVPDAVPVIVLNTESSRNLNDGFSADGYANVTCDGCISADNGIDGIGANGDGFSWHATSTGVIKNSFASNNKKSNITHVHNTSVNMFNNVLYHTTAGSLGGVYSSGNHLFSNNLVISAGNTSTGLNLGTSTIKNNIVYGFDTGLVAGSSAVSDFNNVFSGSVQYRCASAPDNCPNSGSGNVSLNPLFVDVASGNYRLSEFSPLIDAGTSIAGRTTDKDGNPIYGTPDIGPYEYQPPYIMSTTTGSAIGVTSGARVYANGKYRFTKTLTDFRSINLSVAPIGGFASSSYEEWMDISNITWTNAEKRWTASSSVATTTLFVVRNLTPNAPYTIKVDGNTSTTTPADNNGTLSFVYSGGWSTHVFSLEGPTETSVPATPIVTYGGGGSYGPAVSIGTSTVSTGPITYRFTRDLSIGSTGDDVREMQRLLNAKGFTVAEVGAGSKGNETTYFGPATRAAVARLQKQYRIFPTAGYFGPKTRSVIGM